MTRDQIISALRAAQARATRITVVRRIIDAQGNELFRFVREVHAASREPRVDYYD